MMLYDVPPKIEEDCTQIGRQPNPKWKTTLPKMFISEDKGASYLRFARFFNYFWQTIRVVFGNWFARRHGVTVRVELGGLIRILKIMKITR